MDFFSTTFPLARYKLRFRVVNEIQLASYAGSALRGAFGHALMLLSGLEKSDIEQKNSVYIYSAYAAVFEPLANNGIGLLTSLSDRPVSYIIEAPVGGAKHYAVGDFLEFDIVLIDTALQHLGTIILAWRRALMNGLGRNKAGKAELIEVLHCTQNGQISVYSEAHPILKPHDYTLNIPSYNQPQTLHLVFNTALRLQRKGKIVGLNELTPGLLLRNLIRRVSFYWQLLNPEKPLELDVQHLNSLADEVQGIKHLSLKKWRRYSSRQNNFMELNGWQGHWLLQQVPSELLPFVWLGQFLHVGKNTSFGLGGYEISSEPWAEFEIENLIESKVKN